MSEALTFSYWLAHLDVAGAACERPYALLLLLAVPWFFVGRQSGLLSALRAAAFALVVVAMADVRLTAALPESRLSVVAAVDVSDSIDEEGRKWSERYVRSLASALAPGDELAVVQFAADAKVLQGSAAPKQLQWAILPLRSSATNMAAAIDTALSLYPPASERRLVLITDGNETYGSSLDKLPAAKLAKVAVFAAVPPRANGPDVAIDKLLVPAVLPQGGVFPVRVVIRNEAPQREATLDLQVDGESIGSERLVLPNGLHAVEIPYRMDRAGVHRLRARVTTAGDHVLGNNFRDATVTVSGRPRLLLATPRKHSALRPVLKRKGFDVTQILPAEMPESVQGLLGYHVVVFDGVTAKSLANQSLDPLEAYVRDYGGGFVMVGGDDSFGDAELKRTALERLLPVTLEPRKPPKPEREPLALFLLIDRSKSMGYHFRNRFEFSEDASKLVYAKRAALSVVRQLRDSDHIGVIAFDSLAFEIAPLRSLRDNRVVLERDLPRIQVGGGTDFYDGLRSALRQLAAARATNGHVILITDGNTNRPPAEHDEIISGLARAKISVTTIRIGDDQEEVGLLKKISQHTRGAFYSVANADALPELLLKDTHRQVQQTPQGEQTFVPRADASATVLRGIDVQNIPVLSGYAFARLKPQADMVLHLATADKGDPLLATWQLGLGRVVALTADLGVDAKAWTAWEGLGKLLSQTLRWAAVEHTPGDFAVDAVRREDGVTLTLESYSPSEGGVVTARLLDGGQAMDVPLVPNGARRYTAQLPEKQGGHYTLALSTRFADGNVTQRTQVVQVPSGEDTAVSGELERLQPNLTLLQRLSTETGGAVNAPVRTIAGRSTGTRRVDLPLDAWLLPLAMLLFLADIACRRWLAVGLG